MKKYLIIFAMLISSNIFAQYTRADLTWTHSPSKFNCLVNCTFSYNIYEGSSSGNESSTPFATGITSNSFSDNSGTLNGYAGTTRCYIIKYTQTINSVTVFSTVSNETCVNFGTIPPPPPPPSSGVILLGTPK